MNSNINKNIARHLEITNLFLLLAATDSSVALEIRLSRISNDFNFTSTVFSIISFLTWRGKSTNELE